MTTSLPGLRVDIPLPPELVEALGCRYDTRFVGFSWSDLGDQLIVSDGVRTGTGASWAFLGYKRHPAVAPLLGPFNFGSSDRDATHMLLIDRDLNLASVAPVDEANRFLRAQHPPAPEMTPEEHAAFEREFTRLLDEMRNRPIDHEAIAKQMAEQRGRVARMMSWLNMCPDAKHTGLGG